MKNIYKRFIMIFCVATVLISTLRVPTEAVTYSDSDAYYEKHYGLTCPEIVESEYFLYRCNCGMENGISSTQRDAYSNIIQDSRFVPEDDTVFKEIQDALNDEAEKEIEASDVKLEIYHEIDCRIFCGNVLNLFKGSHNPSDKDPTPLSVHSMLMRCSKVKYSFRTGGKNLKFNDDGTTYVADWKFEGRVLAHRNPITNTCVASGLSEYSAFCTFMDAPEVALTSAEITKQYAENIEIEYIFCFEDDIRAIFYCVTNYGDYIYYSSNCYTDDDNTVAFIFPVSGFKTMLDESSYRYAEYRNITFDDAWTDVVDTLTGKDIIYLHERSEILPYIAGGEDRTVNSIADIDYGKWLKKSNTSTQTPTENTEQKLTESIEQKPTDVVGKPIEPQIDNRREQIFTVIFIVETSAIVIMVAIASIFFVRAITRKKLNKE